MKNGMKVALLVIGGVFLLLLSSVTTAYSRNSLSTLEQILGFLMLGGALALSLLNVDRETETKSEKKHSD